MAKYAQIEDGQVVNVVTSDANFAAEQGWVEAPKGVSIGWSYDGTTIAAPPPPPRDFADQQARLYEATKQAYSRAMRPISKQYPAEEREGWGEQVQAAQEVLAGGQNDLIDALRAPTGETANEMANLIITKRQEYLTVYKQVTAVRRSLDAQIEAATTLADLDAIDVNAAFGL
ncbi:MAG: hypothetical protein RLN94_21330 [Roseovarius sp.]|uniref:hypothetical protein n=1 Tax=Roseovarius sp. TaxID=1486281 RepID=UPI0032EC0930